MKEIDGRCCKCGYEGERETRCPKRKDRRHCVHWYDGVDADTLWEMLNLILDVKVSQKVIRTWTAEQLQEADKWAAKSLLRASDNPVRVPPRPKFLPHRVS